MVDGDSPGSAFRSPTSSISVEPTSKAKFVQFTTLVRPRRRCPASSIPILQWPHVEGLRMDEAMHPLTILVVGLYGEVLPNQNGAPLRLVVPWKCGFKEREVGS